MHKHVFTAGTAQKAETLGIVKPLNCSLFHLCFLIGRNVSLNSMWKSLRVERQSRTGKNTKSDSTINCEYSIPPQKTPPKPPAERRNPK
jgi:hypothetical protein